MRRSMRASSPRKFVTRAGSTQASQASRGEAATTTSCSTRRWTMPWAAKVEGSITGPIVPSPASAQPGEQVRLGGRAVHLGGGQDERLPTEAAAPGFLGQHHEPGALGQLGAGGE